MTQRPYLDQRALHARLFELVRQDNKAQQIAEMTTDAAQNLPPQALQRLRDAAIMSLSLRTPDDELSSALRA